MKLKVLPDVLSILDLQFCNFVYPGSMRTDGEKIRQLRTARGMTQAELARRIGVSRQLVWQIENGQIETPVGRIAKIAAELGVSPWELYRDGQAA